MGDNLDLPFRSEVFDAVTSISVVHHLATSGRRVKALRELARILRVGGKVLITVHALDQDSKIRSRDILLPWYQTPRYKVAAGNHSTERGQHDYDDDENCNDYDDSISLPSSDEEEDVFPLQRIRPVRMISDISQERSVFKQTPEQRTWRSLDASPRHDNPADRTRNSLEHPQPGYSCYGFVRKALRRLHSSDSSSRLSLQVSSSSQRRSYSTDSALPTSPDFFFKDNIPYDRQYYFADGDVNHIELRNLDEDDEYPVALPQESRPLRSTKDSSSAPMSNSKSKLVRSFSDFFRRIPKLWNNKTSSSSCNDLQATSILRDSSFQFNASNLQYNIVRSQSTATCTFKFDALPHLERVEELDYFVDLETVLESLDENRGILGRSIPQDIQEICEDRSASLTLLDIENGNVLPVPEEAGRNSEKHQPDSVGYNLTEQNHENQLEEQVPNSDLSNSTIFSYQGTHNAHRTDVSSNYSSVDEQEVTFLGQFVEDIGHVKAVKRSMTEENEMDEVMSKLKHLKVNEWTRSPKRRPDQQQAWHMVNSRTAGPFYDTDDEDPDDEIILSSYYSMPELYKLSDFQDEYYVQKQQTLKKLFLTDMDGEVYSNYYNFVPQQNDNVYRCEVTTIPDNENALYSNPNTSDVFDNVTVSSSKDTFLERITFPSANNDDYEQTLNVICETEQHPESLEEFKDFITQMNKENSSGFAGHLKPKNKTLDFLEFSNPKSAELLLPSTICEGTLHDEKLEGLSCKPSFSQIMRNARLNEESTIVALRDHHEKANESITICSSRCQCPPKLKADIDNRNPSDDETQNYVNTGRGIYMIENHPSVTSSSSHENRKQLNTSDSSLVRLDSRDCTCFTPESCEHNGSASDGSLECSRSAFSSPVQRNQYSASDELIGHGQKTENLVSNGHCETTPNENNERTNRKSREVVVYLQQESPKNSDCLNTDNRLEEKEAYSCTSSFLTEGSITHGSANHKGAHFSSGLSQLEQKTLDSNIRLTESSQINNFGNSGSHNTSSVIGTTKRPISFDESPTHRNRRKLKILGNSVHGRQESIDCNVSADETREAVECPEENNLTDLPTVEKGEKEQVFDSGKNPVSGIKIELQEKVNVCAASCLVNQYGRRKLPLNGNFEIYDEIIPSFDVTASECLSEDHEKSVSVKSNECASIGCGYRKNLGYDEGISPNNENLKISCITDGICSRSKCVFDQKQVSYSDTDNKKAEELFDSSIEDTYLETPASSLERTMSKGDDSCAERIESSRKICTSCSNQEDTTVANSVSRNLRNINNLISKGTSENDLKTQSNSSRERSAKEMQKQVIVDADSNKRGDIRTPNNKAYRNGNVESEINLKEITSQDIPEIKFPVVHESRNSQTLRSSAESPHRGKECNINSCQSPDFKSQSISSETELLSCRKSSLILPTAHEETEDIVDHLYGQVGDEHSSLTTHRYYHLFQEGELHELIENYVPELHVLSISFQGSSWCIEAEKVRVWTI